MLAEFNSIGKNGFAMMVTFTYGNFSELSTKDCEYKDYRSYISGFRYKLNPLTNKPDADLGTEFFRHDCFDKSLVTKAIDNFKKKLLRKYNYRDLKYIIFSEMGNDEENPHNHGIFFFKNSPFEFADISKILGIKREMCHNNKRTFLNYVDLYNPIWKCGWFDDGSTPITCDRAISYCSKYITKDYSNVQNFEEDVRNVVFNKLIDKFHIYFSDLNEDILSEDEYYTKYNESFHKEFVKQVNNLLPFHLQSQGFGTSLINEITYEEWLEGKMTLFEAGTPRTFPIPQYFYRKKFQLSDLDGIYYYTPEGKQFLKDRYTHNKEKYILQLNQTCDCIRTLLTTGSNDNIVKDNFLSYFDLPGNKANYILDIVNRMKSYSDELYNYKQFSRYTVPFYKNDNSTFLLNDAYFALTKDYVFSLIDNYDTIYSYEALNEFGEPIEIRQVITPLKMGIDAPEYNVNIGSISKYKTFDNILCCNLPQFTLYENMSKILDFYSNYLSYYREYKFKQQAEQWRADKFTYNLTHNSISNKNA